MQGTAQDAYRQQVFGSAELSLNLDAVSGKRHALGLPRAACPCGSRHASRCMSALQPSAAPAPTPPPAPNV